MAKVVPAAIVHRVVLVLLALALPVLLGAGPRKPAAAPENSVEMFSAIEKGEIDVRLIPKNSTQVNVLITNKTQQPLTVKLPETFSAIPVLAQAAGGGAGGGGGTRSSSNKNNQNQQMGGGMGGGMGGMGGGMGGMGGGGGGFFNVPPEKVGALKATTVCLEHGKREPQANMAYEIRPLEQATARPEVHEVCRLLANGQVPQRVAQIAAWHLNNDMTWEQLAGKKYHHANGTTEPYFSPAEIRAAMQFVAMTHKIIEQRNKQKGEPTPSQSSLGQR